MLTAMMHVTGRNPGMRFLRYVGAATVLMTSAWLLLAYEGVKTTAEDQAGGWHIYELPSHPILRMVLYLAVGLGLPFLAAWLMGPSDACTDAGKTAPYIHWRSYSFRLGLSFAGVFVTACILAFLEMALLDAGMI
jgi:hypothetical protein